MPVSPVGMPQLPPIGAPEAGARPTPGFSSAVEKLVSAVEESNAAANDAVARMLDGTGEVHDAMIALQRADLSFQLSMQIRNKLVSAYQEIMRMSV